MPDGLDRKTEKRQKSPIASEDAGFFSDTPLKDDPSAYGEEDVSENYNDISVAPDIFSSLTAKPDGKYKFKESIGYGGMKTVIRVRDGDTARDVAMAIMPDAENRPLADKQRFLQEARITARLEHPNIVPVHDIGIDSTGAPYFTMKMLKGETLASIIKKVRDGGDREYSKHYDMNALLRFFTRICNAIAFAHSRGVIHLDLKPENIQIGDFGEVLVLDWGLAKLTNGSESASEEDEEEAQDKSTRSNELPELTLDGVTKGTPGYMAPEQAAGKNTKKDERTDIYSLGAILYTILTMKAPVEGENIEEILVSTIFGNIPSPKEKTPEKLIPSALEAVAMKAMAVNPEERYQSVLEMRDDIIAFMNGFATEAEKAGLAKRTLLFIKRHKLTTGFVSVILMLLIFLGVFALRDYSKSTAGWIKVYEKDFTAKNRNTSGLIFKGNLIKKDSTQWSIEPDGLKMERLKWIWLSDVKVKDNVRVVVRLIMKGVSDAFEVCINSNPKPVPYWWYLPVGYSFQCGGSGGVRDAISKNDDIQSPDIISSFERVLLPDVTHEIVFQKKGETLSLAVDGRESIRVTDIFPPVGKGLDMIGLRTYASSVWLKSVSVYRLAIPEKASPLVAGDVLVELQHFREAIDKYMTIAENYGTSTVAEKALIKAYITAATKLPESPEKDKVLLSVKAAIHVSFPKFTYQERVLEVDALMAWRARRYDQAFDILNEMFTLNPYTMTVMRILQCPHEPLSPDVGKKLLLWISRTKGLHRLDISKFGLESLEPLKDLRLSFLNCSHNKITSLEPLRNMYLETLFCEYNQISSLEPLEDMPMKELNCSENNVSSLRFIKDMPIKRLNCSGNSVSDLRPMEDTSIEKLYCANNKISDLSPLSSLKLDYLDCARNKITSLAPLAGIELKGLNCARNKITSLNPLAGMPLDILNCSYNPITSIEPLRMLPLKNLNLKGCDLISDITPVIKSDTLEKIELPAHIKFSIQNK